MLTLKKYPLFFVIMILLLQISNSYASRPTDEYLKQTIQERSIDESKWSEITRSLNYSKKAKKKQKQQAASSNDSSSNPNSFNFDWVPSNTFFRVLAFLIIIPLIGFILAKLFMGEGNLFQQPRSRKIKTNKNLITIENIEENIHDSDIDDFIQKAINEKKYPLAIRLYYLAIIKELSIHKLIKWKRDKTNKDYIREMRPSNLFSSFREVTRIFERVWYGNNQLEEKDFKNLKPKFKQLIDEVESNKTNSSTS